MRETKQIILPITGTKIEIYTYLSQRGYDAIKEPFYRGKKIEFVQGKGIKKEADKFIEMDAMKEADKANIKHMLHSVEGETGTLDFLYEKIIDLPKKDYEFIVKEINKITKEDDESEDLKKK